MKQAGRISVRSTCEIIFFHSNGVYHSEGKKVSDD